MPDHDPRIDRETNRAIRRIHDQLYADGKLDTARFDEGLGLVLLPVVLGVLFVLERFLHRLELEGAELVTVAVLVLFGLFFVAVYLRYLWERR
jgi:hypothetical protein